MNGFTPHAPPAAAPPHPVAAGVFGALSPLVAEPAVTDVFVNPTGEVWVDRGAGAVPWAGMVIPPAEARDLATRLIAAGDRHVDEATP